MSNYQSLSLSNKLDTIKKIINEQSDTSANDQLEAIRKNINDPTNNSQSNLEIIKKMINKETNICESEIQLESARKRVANKLLNLNSIKNDIDQFRNQTILSDTDLIDDDMLLCGKINGKMLSIDIPPINIVIDLSKSIGSAIMQNKLSLLDCLIAKNIDIFGIQPDILIMCVEMNRDELLNKLLNFRGAPIQVRDYRCVYQLAAKGKLELIKNILEKCHISNIEELVGKILVQAVLNNCINILEHFLTKEAFTGAPDFMHEYFIKAITHNADIQVINFFVENGVDVRQENYLALYTALDLKRIEIVKYFCQKDPNVLLLLTEHQKEKFGLIEIDEINQFIGTNKSCNIYYDDIVEGDKYFQCENKRHHFKEEAWKGWVKNKYEWNCPFCFCQVEKTLFINNV